MSEETEKWVQAAMDRDREDQFHRYRVYFDTGKTHLCTFQHTRVAAQTLVSGWPDEMGEVVAVEELP